MGYDVVLASNNPGKAREIGELLVDTGIRLHSQSEWSVPEAAETGTTFVENAIIKARHACRHTDQPAIADDSGIAVDALAGEPGVRSARFAGTHGDDEANNRYLIQRLAGVPWHQRTARYHCVMVYMAHADDPTPVIAEGSWEGVIQDQARGANGFGYDPHFYVVDHGCTAAELEPATKNRVSHRGLAVQGLAERLRASTTGGWSC